MRRRGPFVAELVRALKERNVPVAGVDRMILTEQMPKDNPYVIISVYKVQ